jgi:hypothetical protein
VTTRRTPLALGLAGALSIAALGAGGLAPSAAATRPAVHETRTIGHTVQGRDIRAFRLGDENAARTVVLLGVLHGSERDPARTLRTLRDGRRPVLGVNLWIIPVLNVDGARAQRRTNAHGVDLNRNFPDRWSRSVTGAGRAAASEPETRALMRFLDRIDPDVVISLHQPFGVVDTSESKNPALARALGRELGLPRRDVDCGGPCHGTLTGWFNRHHAGEAITVEFSRHPTRTYLTHTAVLGLLAAVRARLG